MKKEKKKKNQKVTRKKLTRKKKKKDNSLRVILVIGVVIMSMLGLFQLCILGIEIDSIFNYVFGLTRYITYL
ncbi:hypothetical protein, partial [Staphylococcus chromogenes]